MADLLGRAEAADQAEAPDGMRIPEALTRREKRPAEIARAKAIIEARAKERHARERAGYEAKMAARDAKASARVCGSWSERWRPRQQGTVAWCARSPPRGC